MASIKSGLPPIKKRDKTAQVSVILGDCKVGKTTLASTASELGFTLLLNFEDRVGHIQETENLRFYPFSGKVCTTSDLKELCKFLTANKDHGIEYIIIDTIDTMFFNIKTEGSRTSISFDQRNAINLNILDFIKTIKTELGINLILTAHEKKDKETGKLRVGLDTDLFKLINNLVDNVFYLEINFSKKRELHLKNHSLFQAAMSVPIEKIDSIPDSIEDPTFKKIMEYYNGDVAETKTEA